MSDTKAKKKGVLIVDDEALFLKSVTEGLKPYGKIYNFEVLTAGNGREAIKILKNAKPDLLVTDLRMPEVDGFKLISHVLNNFPSLPIVVMTAFGSSNIQKKVKELGILHYLEKPVEFDEFLEKILGELNRGKTSRIEGITVATILQLVWMEKMTCTLTIKSGKNSGQLFLKSGDLLDAVAGKQKGKDAAMTILTWEDVAIDLKDVCTIGEDKIGLPLTEILLESFRIKDEKKKADTAEYKKDKSPKKKEDKMDVKKLNKAIETLKENLGGGLMATDIYGAEDAQSVAGWNSNPAACALFSQITARMESSLKEGGFPGLGRYYLLDLVESKMVLVIPMGDYQWGMLIDAKKAPMGMLLNLALPKAISAFEEALTSV